MTPPSARSDAPRRLSGRGILAVAALALALVALQVAYAALADLRTDEAYYWTWSKETVLSFLDHPPMVAWFVRLGTFLFGDTNFGARFGSLLAGWLSQALLAAIVWRQTRDGRAVALVVLMPLAALDYGLFGSRVVPDAPLILFSLAMAWALLRLVDSGDGRWWWLAGLFGGLALLSKYIAVLLVPAILAFALVPPWRRRWLRSPHPWIALVIALVVFAPVLIWNAQHDWASFRFQLVRAGADHGASLRTVGDFLGVQAVMVGPILFPVALAGALMLGGRGLRMRDPAAILIAGCALVPFAFFLWRSVSLRVGDTWPLVLWPFAFAATAINLARLRSAPRRDWIARTAEPWAQAAVALGAVLTAGVFYYYVVSDNPGAGARDPVAKEAGYRAIADRAQALARETGATWIATSHYRIYAMMRWHLRDGGLPVIEVNERSRYLGFRDPGRAAIASGIGLYVDSAPGEGSLIETATPARLTPVGEAERVWRGVVVERFVFKTVAGWTPDLAPPPGTPFYRWNWLE